MSIIKISRIVIMDLEWFRWTAVEEYIVDLIQTLSSTKYDKLFLRK